MPRTGQVSNYLNMLVISYNILKTLNADNSKCHIWTYALLALSLHVEIGSVFGYYTRNLSVEHSAKSVLVYVTFVLRCKKNAETGLLPKISVLRATPKVVVKDSRR